MVDLQPFRPIDSLRRLEAEFTAQAEASGGSFEALGSLGCEALRLGDPDQLVYLVKAVMGPAPFDEGPQDYRLKLSAKARKPVIIDLTCASRDFGTLSDLETLVQAAGGIVQTSKTSAGHNVKITLPLAEAAVDQLESATVKPEESAPLAGLRILIADDSATNRLVLEEMLSDTQAILTSVTDGREALDAWLSREFDFLLLDISMPVMDGVTAIREIRRHEAQKGATRPIPAIAVTANALVNQIADYLEAGFDTHLAKPFRRRDLLHAIQTLRL